VIASLLCDPALAGLYSSSSAVKKNSSDFNTQTLTLPDVFERLPRKGEFRSARQSISWFAGGISQRTNLWTVNVWNRPYAAIHLLAQRHPRWKNAPATFAVVVGFAEEFSIRWCVTSLLTVLGVDRFSTTWLYAAAFTLSHPYVYVGDSSRPRPATKKDRLILFSLALGIGDLIMWQIPSANTFEWRVYAAMGLIHGAYTLLAMENDLPIAMAGGRRKSKAEKRKLAKQKEEEEPDEPAETYISRRLDSLIEIGVSHDPFVVNNRWAIFRYVRKRLDPKEAKALDALLKSNTIVPSEFLATILTLWAYAKKHNLFNRSAEDIGAPEDIVALLSLTFKSRLGRKFQKMLDVFNSTDPRERGDLHVLSLGRLIKIFENEEAIARPLRTIRTGA
jgi:hypothetical protein